MEQSFKIPLAYQKLSKADAARIIGMSRPTFYRNYLGSGKISISSDDNGKELIAFDELFRVFGEQALRGLREHIGHVQKNENGQEATAKTDAKDTRTDSDTLEIRIENARMSERLTALQQRIQDYETRINEKDDQIRRYFDELQTTRRLLEDKSRVEPIIQPDNLALVQQGKITELEQKLSTLSDSLKAIPQDKPKGFWAKWFGG